MYASDDILESARAIRPYLPELLGGHADIVDDVLADLLGQAQAGQNVDNLILDVLTRDEVTRAWMAKFLRDKCPPDVKKLYQPPPGHIEPVTVPTYACPKGDYVWYRRAVGIPIRVCPTHGIALVPVKES